MGVLYQDFHGVLRENENPKIIILTEFTFLTEFLVPLGTVSPLAPPKKNNLTSLPLKIQLQSVSRVQAGVARSCTHAHTHSSINKSTSPSKPIAPLWCATTQGGALAHNHCGYKVSCLTTALMARDSCLRG